MSAATGREWYILGFTVSVIITVFLWVLSILIYRANRKEFLNRALSISLLILGIWSLTGFIDKLAHPPSLAFTLWSYRVAYAAGTLAAGAFLLFCIAFYRGQPPSKTQIALVAFVSSIGVISSASPYGLRSVHIEGETLLLEKSFLFPVMVATILLNIAFTFFVLTRKYRESSGLDRIRTKYILFSLIMFFSFALVFTVIIPLLSGNEEYAYLAFPFALIPISTTYYTITHYHLLNIRIAIRKIGVYITGALAFAIPFIMFLYILSALNVPPIYIYGGSTVLFLLLFVASPFIWKTLKTYASRVLFSGTYDETELAEKIFTTLAESRGMQDGIARALSEIINPLGVSRIEMVLPPGVVTKNSWVLSCARNESDGNIETLVDEKSELPDFLYEITKISIAEELKRWPKSEGDMRIALELENRGFSACFPIRHRNESRGFLLLGSKISSYPVDASDINFLQMISERLALFIDNYSLSARLSAQLEEQESLYRELHEAYKFKSEIIQVASHEFRTPITVASGFALTLKNNWDRLDESEKISFLSNIVNACERITDLTNQFLSVSSLEEGKIHVNKMPFRLNTLFNKIFATLNPEEQERVIIEADPEMYLVSDPEHLSVILRNIVENALRFSPADKPVIVRAWKNSVCDFIQVTDFGSGIPEDKREKVFEPFVRLESITHHSKGMGLGLYIVRLLSSRLGLEVEIESSKGKGTSITLSIAYE